MRPLRGPCARRDEVSAVSSVRGTDDTAEMETEGFDRAESRRVRHLPNGEAGRLHEFAGTGDSLADEPRARRGTEGSAEVALEGPKTHSGLPRQIRDHQILVEMVGKRVE